MKTLVVGASPNSARYSYKAVRLLKRCNHEVVPLGIRDGEIEGLDIIKGKPDLVDIHTITMYIAPAKQSEYYDYLLSLSPERIIFNPGTENAEFINLAEVKGIETVQNCTLVMLNSGLF
ncbi:MAG: CoA-binding protein [Bacteroidales bacterium]|nr:CoA-binding protein [Bacteroidales bacterium]